LRIIKHGILAVDFMFDIEIARVRSIPVALPAPPASVRIIHLNLHLGFRKPRMLAIGVVKIIRRFCKRTSDFTHL
jgi:hypothetical protein